MEVLCINERLTFIHPQHTCIWTYKMQKNELRYLGIDILSWQGDLIEEFQPLCEVQSDKATIEITSRYKGKVAHINYIPGDIVKVRISLYFVFFWS